ncbi:GNAT family N-acetyltransferase [Aestuariimicrobium soli]|uniref:GNAT family N-acetyltransferase n=1 Tax=Aestuariimicrobium soli TaxID=2035834 RepID=UPI003EB9D7EB
MADVTVTHAPSASRYEVHFNGELAGFIDYVQSGDVLDLTHTEVFPQFGGQGIGGQLVQGALDQIREAGQTIVPTCPFVATFVKRHPDYADLLA